MCFESCVGNRGWALILLISESKSSGSPPPFQWRESHVPHHVKPKRQRATSCFPCRARSYGLPATAARYGSALTYDAENRITSAAQSGIGSMDYSYDGAGRRVQEISTYNTENRVTEHSFPNYFSTIANGVSTAYEYSDPLDRVTLISRADGIANAESHTTYWYANPTFVGQFQDQTLVGDGALRNDTLYDGLGRPIETRATEITGSQYDRTGTWFTT